MKSGIYPVVHVPLKKDESIDIEGLYACLEFYEKSDVSGVTILGSGGELPYFSDSEQLAIVEATHKRLGGYKSIIAGVLAYGAKQAISKIESYGAYVDAVLLLLTDYYISHFEEYLNTVAAIASSSRKPILFYYFPQITKRFLTPKQLIAILSIDTKSRESPDLASGGSHNL